MVERGGVPVVGDASALKAPSTPWTVCDPAIVALQVAAVHEPFGAIVNVVWLVTTPTTPPTPLIPVAETENPWPAVAVAGALTRMLVTTRVSINRPPCAAQLTHSPVLRNPVPSGRTW